MNLTAAEIENIKVMYLREREAAQKLFVEKCTIRKHRHTIFQKLSTHTTAETILKALKMGLVKIDDYLLED